MEQDKMDSYTIIWGTGFIYEKYKELIKSEYPEANIWDRKFQNCNQKKYDGYTILSPYAVDKKEKCHIVLCMANEKDLKEIESSSELRGCHFTRLTSKIPIDRRLTTNEIKEKMNANNGVYKDDYGNVIECYSKDILDRVSFCFTGKNAHVRFGKDIWIYNKLDIQCGNDCSINIGDNTTINNAVIFSAYAKINIGNDCMISYGVFIRNHDSHFIFDKITGERINYSRDINLGNHVWVGQGTFLLSGFSIGDGAIVGAGSVSSSSFGTDMVIGGNPAKVLRNDVCWNRAMTWTQNYTSLSELKYR